jgi:hypothetical protein
VIKKLRVSASHWSLSREKKSVAAPQLKHFVASFSAG